MNRRDYLIQMGAASAFVGMSNLLSPSVVASAQTKQGRQSVRVTTTKPAFLFTPQIPNFPSSTNLTVFFGGLMGISNTNHGAAQVGFQKGMGNHKLEINVYLITSEGACHKLSSITGNDLAGVKAIDVDFSPQQSANVNFFHKANFDRKPTDDKRDFGWVLDFEDSLLYPDGVDIIQKPSPVLTLNQGTFYTHQLTNSKFNIIDEADQTVQQTVNQVPRLVGAAINIPAGTDAVLNLDGVTAAELPFIANVRYEIQFLNYCRDSGSHCMGNDFDMNYLMAKPKNTSAKKYGLSIDQQMSGTSLQMCPPHTERGTDEAPCMATGFGRQGGF